MLVKDQTASDKYYCRRCTISCTSCLRHMLLWMQLCVRQRWLGLLWLAPSTSCFLRQLRQGCMKPRHLQQCPVNRFGTQHEIARTLQASCCRCGSLLSVPAVAEPLCAKVAVPRTPNDCSVLMVMLLSVLRQSVAPYTHGSTATGQCCTMQGVTSLSKGHGVRSESLQTHTQARGTLACLSVTSAASLLSCCLGQI
jgi:hypothetical protein